MALPVRHRWIWQKLQGMTLSTRTQAVRFAGRDHFTRLCGDTGIPAIF
jgi:hypothetical protein